MIYSTGEFQKRILAEDVTLSENGPFWRNISVETHNPRFPSPKIFQSKRLWKRLWRRKSHSHSRLCQCSPHYTMLSLWLMTDYFLFESEKPQSAQDPGRRASTLEPDLQNIHLYLWEFSSFLNLTKKRTEPDQERTETQGRILVSLRGRNRNESSAEL